MKTDNELLKELLERLYPECRVTIEQDAGEEVVCVYGVEDALCEDDRRCFYINGSRIEYYGYTL